MTLRLIRRLSAGAIAGFAALGQAGAQARPDSTDTARVRLQTVTVTAVRAAAVVGGASAVVLRTEQLRASPAPLLEQVLRETPFVNVRQNSRGETELSVRGSDSRQAAVMVQGVPLSLGWDHRADPSMIPITGSENMVVVRGLGTLLNGPNTLGGSVEITQRPSAAREAWAGAGFDQTGALVTTLGGGSRLTSVKGGPLSVRGGFSYRTRDGFALPAGATDPTASDGLRTNSDSRTVDGNASVNWSGAMGRSLSMNLSAFDAERGVPPEEHISSPRLWRYPFQSRAVVAVSGSSGLFTNPLGMGSIDVGVGYNRGRVKIQAFGDRTYATVIAEELGDESSLVTRARLTQSLGNYTLKTAITASDIHYDETLSGALAGYRQLIWSGGAELERPVGLATTLSGGLVFDQASTPETGGRPRQPATDAIGWRAGAAREFGPTFRLHASASQRSRFPSLRELYSGALNRFLPNPSLKPETLLGLEAGFTMNRAMGSRTTTVAEVTGFRHNLKDAVVRIVVAAPGNPFQRINRDRIESTGLEMMGGLTLGEEDRAWSVTGDALVQNIAIHDQTLVGQPERHSENNPEMRGSLELGAPLPLKLRGVANTRYTGLQYCINADTGNEMTLASQAETDLALERGFWMTRGLFRTMRAVLSVDNVANATVFDQCGLPQPGRTLRVMFTLR